MNKETMTHAQRQQRMNVRNFLLVATSKELQEFLDIALSEGDTFKAECTKEIQVEREQEK